LSPDPSWKLDYSNLERFTAEEIVRLREEAEKARITARDIRVKSVGT
jgi:D-proline reductase (dithiol) PrdB